jgi:seryl-tRNA synthetase
VPEDDYESPVRDDGTKAELVKVKDDLKKLQSQKHKSDTYFENELIKIREENTKLKKELEALQEERNKLIQEKA